MVMNLFVVFVGGGIGSVLRFLTSKLIKAIGLESWVGTLLVNFFGSLLMIFIALKIFSLSTLSENIKLFLLVGLLGGLTTYSTFNYELINAFTNNDFKTFFLVLFCNVLIIFFASIIAFKAFN